MDSFKLDSQIAKDIFNKGYDVICFGMIRAGEYYFNGNSYCVAIAKNTLYGLKLVKRRPIWPKIVEYVCGPDCRFHIDFENNLCISDPSDESFSKVIPIAILNEDFSTFKRMTSYSKSDCRDV